MFGGLANDPNQIGAEYQRMEQELENKFFLSGPGILIAGTKEEDPASPPDPLDPLLAEITHLLNRREKEMARERIEKLFFDLRENGRFSTIYVKYVCTEIVKAILEGAGRKQGHDFHRTAERIYKTQNLNQLQSLLLGLMDEGAQDDTEPGKKVIEEVLHLIHRDYRKDISLESLAEKVYLSPGYLSRLFKNETGTSIVKYLTSYRLKRASELLRRTNKKIVDISNEVLGWLLHRGPSVIPILGVKSPAQLEENLGAMDAKLSAEELAEMDAICPPA